MVPVQVHILSAIADFLLQFLWKPVIHRKSILLGDFFSATNQNRYPAVNMFDIAKHGAMQGDWAIIGDEAHAPDLGGSSPISCFGKQCKCLLQLLIKPNFLAKSKQRAIS